MPRRPLAVISALVVCAALLGAPGASAARAQEPQRIGELARPSAALRGASRLPPANPRSLQAPAAPHDPGSANASAQLVRVRLAYAGFAVEASTGRSIASYRNTEARASSAAADVNSITGLLGLPTIEATEASSAGGDERQESAVDAGGNVGHEIAVATQQPSSSASVQLAGASVPGLLEVSGGTSTASTSFTDGQREAHATVEIASLSLGGGLVSLRGLRWHAIHRSGASGETEATFDVAGLRLAGVPVPLGDIATTELTRTLNRVLAVTGIVLEMPTMTELPDGSVNIGALRVGIEESELGADLLGPIIAELRPALLPVFEGATEIDERVGLAGLIIDLALGVVDGSGGLVVSVGGANAGTDDQIFDQHLGGPVAPPSTTTVPPSTTSTAPPATPATSPPAPPTTALPAATPEESAVASPPVAASTSTRCALVAAQRRGSCRDENVLAAIALIAAAVVALGGFEVRARRLGDHDSEVTT